MGNEDNIKISNVNKYVTIAMFIFFLVGNIVTVVVYGMNHEAMIERNSLAIENLKEDINDLKKKQEIIQNHENRITVNEIHYSHISESLVEIKNILNERNTK